MIGAFVRVRPLAAAAGWITIVLVLGILLVSVALAPVSNWPVRTALAAFCILAVGRPADALLITAALLGFGIILSHLAGVPPLRVPEVLVVASLAGCFARAIPHDSAFRRALTGTISIPIVLLGMTAVASTMVWMRIHQFQTGHAAAYFERLLQFVTRAYFVERGEFTELVSTGVLLQGLGLYVAVAAVSRMDPAFFDRALRMLAIGGAGLAVMSVVRLAEILLRNPAAGEMLRSGALRISPQIADLIAAGSYFSLCGLVAVGLAMASSRHRLLWLAVQLPLLAALYLTGSRSVILAPLAGLVVPTLVMVRQRVAAMRSAIVGVVAIAVVMIASYPWLTGRQMGGEVARLSVETRVELARTSARVIATRSLFGVGIDRYHLTAQALASPRLNSLWPARKNPHNDFLRIGAELGLVGLALFAWILAVAIRRIWQGVRNTWDSRLAGLAGGLVAILVTTLVSDPLMVREVSFAFWIALGLAVGQSAQSQSPREARARPPWGWPLAALAGALLIVSVPLRAQREIAATDVTRVTYGLFEWNTAPDGRAYRVSGPRVTLFADGRSGLMQVELSSALPNGAPQQVEVRLDGRVANRVTVGADWQWLRTVLPAAPSAGLRRIELVVSPTWTQADVTPGTGDQRAFGVKVGRINVTMAPKQPR